MMFWSGGSHVRRMAGKAVTMFTNPVVFQIVRAFRTCGFAGVCHGTIVPRKQIGILLLIFLSGCATSPPESPWDGLTVETEFATAALDCGAFPLPTRATAAEIVYDEAGVNDLEVYRICSESNQANVDEHAAQIGQLKIARAALVEAGQAQRNIAIMRAEMLVEERRHHFWQSFGYWFLIVGAIAL